MADMVSCGCLLYTYYSAEVERRSREVKVEVKVVERAVELAESKSSRGSSRDRALLNYPREEPLLLAGREADAMALTVPDVSSKSVMAFLGFDHC